MFSLFFVGQTILLVLIHRKRDLCDVELELASSPEEADQLRTNIWNQRIGRIAQLHWIIGRLDFIAQGLGVHQARIFSRILRKDLAATHDPHTGMSLTQCWVNEQQMQHGTVNDLSLSNSYESFQLPCAGDGRAASVTFEDDSSPYMGETPRKLSWNEYFTSRASI